MRGEAWVLLPSGGMVRRAGPIRVDVLWRAHSFQLMHVVVVRLHHARRLSPSAGLTGVFFAAGVTGACEGC